MPQASSTLATPEVPAVNADVAEMETPAADTAPPVTAPVLPRPVAPAPRPFTGIAAPGAPQETNVRQAIASALRAPPPLVSKPAAERKPEKTDEAPAETAAEPNPSVD